MGKFGGHRCTPDIIVHAAGVCGCMMHDAMFVDDDRLLAIVKMAPREGEGTGEWGEGCG